VFKLFAVRRYVVAMVFGQPMLEQGGVVLLVDVSATSVSERGPAGLPLTILSFASL
jgi:hypothetical protein